MLIAVAVLYTNNNSDAMLEKGNGPDGKLQLYHLIPMRMQRIDIKMGLTLLCLLGHLQEPRATLCSAHTNIYVWV